MALGESDMLFPGPISRSSILIPHDASLNMVLVYTLPEAGCFSGGKIPSTHIPDFTHGKLWLPKSS